MTGRAIELFAGYGGLALAIEDVLDVETVAMSEVDPGALKILTERFPDVASLGDVTEVDWHKVNRLYGPVDVLGGGSPCQDISSAGSQAGMREGTRSGLWFSMLNGIRILRPRLVIWENVRGALSAPADSCMEPDPWSVGGTGDGEPPLRALGRVLGDLADIGYDAAWTCVRASDVGAPHGRARVFVIAWPASEVRPACPGAGRRRHRHRRRAGTVTDWWESRDSRNTCGGASKTWPNEYDQECGETGPMPDAECSREKGHPGRHMASLGPAWGCRVVAAWPGTHAPRKADLTDPPGTVVSRACAGGGHDGCRGAVTSVVRYPTCRCTCHAKEDDRD